MAQDSQDPHKNNMGFTVGPETDYGTWDWRKIMVAILGAVNTDAATAQDKLGGASSPDTLRLAATNFRGTADDMKYVYDSLRSWHDYLLNPDAPMWRGDAAEAFRGLMDKTLASVKGHLDPLTNTPTYETTLKQAADDLDSAIKTIQKQDGDAAQSVIDRWNKENDSSGGSAWGRAMYNFVHGVGQILNINEQPPWYDYNGTKIVAISHYPDIDQQLSKDMQGTLTGLVGQYKAHLTSMPAPAPLPSPDPGSPNGGGPQTINFGPAPKINFGPAPKFPDPPKQPPPPKQPSLSDLGLKKGPDGQLLGPDGQPIGAPGGPGSKINDPNLAPPNLINTPNGPAVVGPDGKTLLDPRTGKPLKGPDGKPLTVNDLPKNGVIPPALGAPPPIKTVTPPNLKGPGEVRPPELTPITSGGPPKTAAELQSDGALKSGAKEFGDGAPTKGGGAAEKGSGGEPMPMGGGGMGGAGQGDKDRDRTTWLTEDEAIWGAETFPDTGTLGR